MRKYLILIALIFSPFTANASSCYSLAEIEAEQGIRIHSELMVIGLNCQHMGIRAGMNVFGDYRQFTARHASILAAYEQTLIDYFKTNGQNPESSLNTLRTHYANKISDDVANMRPDVFCSRYVPRIKQASQMSGDDLRRWAATIYESHPVSRPLCAGY
jgi:hypothetical protein